jgi:hypothetical protein
MRGEPPAWEQMQLGQFCCSPILKIVTLMMLATPQIYKLPEVYIYIECVCVCVSRAIQWPLSQTSGNEHEIYVRFNDQFVPKDLCNGYMSWSEIQFQGVLLQTFTDFLADKKITRNSRPLQIDQRCYISI